MFDSILLFFLLGAGTGAVYVLAAQGLVLIHRGSGVVNFANGGFALIGAYTFFELQESGIPEVPAIAIGRPMGAYPSVVLMCVQLLP